MLKCDFSKVALQIRLQHGCSPSNSLHIFRITFPNKTSAGFHLFVFEIVRYKATKI